VRPTARSRHGPRGDRGSATIEVAVAFPVVMLLLMLVVQAGVYFHTRAVMTSAAHKGLDAARVEEGSVADARSVTEAFLDRNAAALEARNVEVSRGAERAEVSVSGDVTSLIFGVDLFPVRVTASAPIEAVTP
jgi:Flp pilus assembly protein TadG